MNRQVVLQFIPRAYLETAFSAAFLAWAHGSLYASPNALVYSVFIFFGTWSIYNLLRVVSLFRLVQTELNWRTVPHLMFVPLHIALASIAGLTAVVLLFYLEFDFNGMLLLAVLFFVTLSYRFRWFKHQGKSTALSEFPYLKSLLVAGVWTIICSMIPSGMEEKNTLLYLSFFVYFLGLSIPFDIRDLKKDAPSRRTIPQIFGVANARTLSLLLILIAHILLTYQMQCSIWVFSASAMIHAILISRTCHKTEKAVLYRLLDAAPILLGIGMVV